MTATQSLRLLFGVTLFSALIWYVHPTTMINTLIGLNPDHMVLAACLVVVSVLLGAWNAYLLVDPEKQLGFFGFLLLYWLSWAVGLIFPGQVGDVATLSALLKRRGIDISRTLGRSLVDKLISFALMLLFAGYGLLLLPAVDLSEGGMAVVSVVAILMLVYWLQGSMQRMLSRWFPGAVVFIRRLPKEMTLLVKSYPGRTILNVIFTIFKISLVGSAYWYVFRAEGYDSIELWSVISLTAATSIVAYLPLSFNGIGTVEITGVVLFATLGVSEADVLAAFIVLRVMVLLLAWVPTGLWLALGWHGGKTHD